MTRTKNVYRDRTNLSGTNGTKPSPKFCFHADEAARLLVGAALLGLALVGMIQLFHGSTAGTHGPAVRWDAPRFYFMAWKKEPFMLAELFPSKGQCVLPIGIGSLARLGQFRKQYRVSDNTDMYADSDHDWFIVVFQNGQPAYRVVTIDGRRVALTNTDEICGENLKVSFDKDGRAVISQ